MIFRSEQYEKLSSGKLKLKLGMYSDGKRLILNISNVFRLIYI